MLDIMRRTNDQPVPYRSWNLANVGGFSDLFSEFDRLWREVASSFGRWVDSYPVDLYETGEEVVLEMAVPGLSKDDLDISLEGRQLTIRGNFNPAAAEERRYWLQGIPRGSFSRTLTLPAGVEADKVQATVQNGLLRISMPKTSEAKARRIAVKAE
ncbi:MULTISPECIES: Hsp20/alpha crystallin family protein [unclassified Meiothermus]|uniref:Hsp20/alpha crystallin family protein n=1 Tax=unclassified Meiothermus TaxID=370471 RepID=UPI000D7CE035|nr:MULTISPECIES: Hsp20/alpha crystallin family protein [unclassified Meiothermus]PZA06894.1 Hsp20/alpha crystallin family protein [Meiothermus sp. Pnk-1]RYM30874.1 Hsp20/alpha crystallin family protein [Meiothermus sp. PNK-Is4]